MDKATESKIEKRVHEIFKGGMPGWAFDARGLQTRGSFLKRRAWSPFRELRVGVKRKLEQVKEVKEEEKDKDCDCKSVASESSSGSEVVEGEVERQIFRQRVRDNRQYRERMAQVARK